MPRPGTQARAARALRRQLSAMIAADADAAALAQQLIYLAQTMDDQMSTDGRVDVATARAYLDTRNELLHKDEH